MNESDEGNKGVALSIGAASSTALVATPKGKGKKRRTKSRLSLKKKKVATPKAKQARTNLYEPQMFIRRIVYKRNDNGDIILGSVQCYDANIEKFFVLYEDGEERNEVFSELRNKLATGKVISEALPPQSNNVSKKTVTEEKKRSASGEGSSAPSKKKGKASGKNATKSKN